MEIAMFHFIDSQLCWVWALTKLIQLQKKQIGKTIGKREKSSDPVVSPEADCRSTNSGGIQAPRLCEGTEGLEPTTEEPDFRRRSFSDEPPYPLRNSQNAQHPTSGIDVLRSRPSNLRSSDQTPLSHFRKSPIFPEQNPIKPVRWKQIAEETNS
ncbi:predicted protein [Arabidopsis lyrata subsp. lyrata]|uniref:Predicted protein n=1 Tax=Arabidopsis lyrata subsp. lyrata TaxID=81972 RepID=D7LA39_ARALL|nr:predicted protein [Arabidopsis lyrata subsp. lyrata]